MKVKIQLINGEIKEEEITPIYFCKHVDDTNLYPSLQEVKFDEDSQFILVENNKSPYGYSVLWLKDRKNKIYEWEGFGHSGASSVICSLLKDVIKLKSDNISMMESLMNTRQVIKKLIGEFEESEVK